MALVAWRPRDEGQNGAMDVFRMQVTFAHYAHDTAVSCECLSAHDASKSNIAHSMPQHMATFSTNFVHIQIRGVLCVHGLEFSQVVSRRTVPCWQTSTDMCSLQSSSLHCELETLNSQIRAVLRARGLEFCDDEEEAAGASLATEHAHATADALRHEQLVSAGVGASTTDSEDQSVGQSSGVLLCHRKSVIPWKLGR